MQCVADLRSQATAVRVRCSLGPECSSLRGWASIPCCAVTWPKGTWIAGVQWSFITRLETRTKESIECASVVVSNQSPLRDGQRAMKVKGFTA